jgi:hypothetical protein
MTFWYGSEIRGSMPLNNGSRSGSGSCYFRHCPSRRQQENNFTPVFLLITVLFEGTFTSFFKDTVKSQEEVRKQ